jgi:hypothetical protein
MDDHTLKQLIFANVLGMQYHPRNAVPPENDVKTIQRAIAVAELALFLFNKEYDSCP